jgi:hypothetical protein
MLERNEWHLAERIFVPFLNSLLSLEQLLLPDKSQLLILLVRITCLETGKIAYTRTIDTHMRAKMDTLVLKRQLITDATGKPVGVILPLEEYRLVEAILDQNFVGKVADDTAVVDKSDLPSIQEGAFFGMWADHPGLQGRTSRDWLEEVRQEQWTRS